jgi:hypothetical protein
MNKTAKVILIVLGIIVFLFLVYFLPKIIINSWSNSFIPKTSGNPEVCSKDICNRINADNSSYNESSAICICYKQGQIVKQTRIS